MHGETRCLREPASSLRRPPSHAHLLLTGVATNLTVEQTARCGTDLGLTVYTISDCVAGLTEEAHAGSLANLELATAGCLTAEQVLAS